MAEKKVPTKENVSANAKSFIHILRIKDLPTLVLNNRIGQRHEFFRGKMTDGEQECTLTLVLYPGGYDDDHSDHVALRASLDQEIPYSLVIDVAVCDQNNEECFKRRIALSKENYNREVIKDFAEKSVLVNDPVYLRNNSLLKLSCRVFVNCDERKLISTASLVRNAHLNDYEKLFYNDEFSDFEITAGETVFKVHKCILATHSPVFAAMFHSDMSEKSQASTKIEDVDAETMREFLRFIYIGKVEKADELVNNLWIVADKYDVERLKEVCEEKLIEKLSSETISETLCLLDKFNMSKLRVSAIDFIIKNGQQIVTEDKFNTTIRNLSAEILSDVLCAVLKNSKISS